MPNTAALSAEAADDSAAVTHGCASVSSSPATSTCRTLFWYVAAVSVSESLLGADEKTLKEHGILKIEMPGSEYQKLTSQMHAYRLTFDLIYEYKEIPDEAQEVIEQIPVNLSLGEE